MADIREAVLQAATVPLAVDHGRSLRPMLSSDSPLLVALGQVHLRAGEMAMSLQSEDLVSPEGIARALKKQGMVEGLRLAIEVVIGPVQEFEDSRQGAGE